MKNRQDLMEYKVYVKYKGDEARKVGWGQIMKSFEYHTDECELYSLGNGEPL